MTASVPEAAKENVLARRGKTGFPRSARLLRHADFERVYKLGRRHFSALITVFYLRRETIERGAAAKSGARSAYSSAGLRVGFTVGRVLGGAVERNRIKRRMREAVRLSFPAAQIDADIVINPKKKVLVVEFQDLRNELRRAFEVIETKLKP